MIVYSVTVSVDQEIEEDWKSWMLKHHIPDVLATPYFSTAVCRRQLDGAEEEGRTTYNIEYSCDSMDDYEKYQVECAPALQKDHSDRYAGRVSASRKLYEVESA